MKIVRTVTTSLICLIAVFTSARSVGGTPDVWKSVDAAADGVFYLNTGQAEKKMDRDLWTRIQNDKENAKKESKAASDGGPDFDLFKKDVALLANVYIVSKKPLRLAICGEITFDGSEKGVLSNIVAMASEIAKEGEGRYVRGGTRLRPVHELKMNPEGGECISLKIEEKESSAQFEFLYNLNAFQRPNKTEPPPARSQAVTNVKNGDSAIGIVLNAPAWSGVFPEDTKDMRVFSRMLRAMDTAEVRVRVDGVEVRTSLVGTFKSEVLAKRYSKDLVDSLPLLSQTYGNGLLVGLEPRLSGRVVSILVRARLDLAWSHMAEFGTAATNSVPTDVAIDDDDE